MHVKEARVKFTLESQEKRGDAKSEEEKGAPASFTQLQLIA